ncbi:MAG: tetratricopeptide repeat protein [Streptosporangiaceae bacterium]
MPFRGVPAGPPARFRVGDIPPLAAGFSGRPDTARGILDALVPGSAVALVPGSPAAEGKHNWLGASGKTQIAVMAADALWQSGAVDIVVWISATSLPAVLARYAEAWIAATGLEPAGTAESVATRFTGWLAGTPRPWLVVLDDVPPAAELDGFWPEGPAGRLLITSARSAATAGRPRMRVFPVGFFSTREALDSLTGRLSASPAQRQGIIDLIEALDREPLALAQAAAVISSSAALACRDYEDHFGRRRQQIGALAGGAPPAASVTWTLSLGQAEHLLPGQAARLMLVLLALLDGRGIPGPIFSTRAVGSYLRGTAPGEPADPGPAWDALLVLERAGLITISQAAAAPAILMSHAVQAAIWAAAPAAFHARAAHAAAAALLEAWPADEPHPWTAAALRANAASLQTVATDTMWADGCHPLLLRAGRSLDDARMAGPAVAYWRDLAVNCDNKLPPGHPDALVVAALLAGAYLTAGWAAEAVAWYQRVLTERSYELAPGHPAITAARTGLGDALIAAGDPAAAVTVLSLAVTEAEQFRGPGHPDTLAARTGLARAHQAAGDAGAAIGLLTQTLAERERSRGSRDVDTITTRDLLAAALLADGRIKQAVSAYKRVLADREAVLGPDHPDTIAARTSLAGAYCAAGKMPAAVQLAERACAGSERTLGADHAATLARRAQLAGLYYAVGRLGDAEALLRETVGRCERVLPPGDLLTQTVRQRLADIPDSR